MSYTKTEISVYRIKNKIPSHVPIIISRKGKTFKLVWPIAPKILNIVICHVVWSYWYINTNFDGLPFDLAALRQE